MRARLAFGSAVGLSISGSASAIPGALLPYWQTAFAPGAKLSLYYNLSLLGMLVGLTLGRWIPVRQPWFSASLVLAALALAGISVAPSFNSIALAALPLGLAVGMINLHANALPGELYPERHLVVLSQVNAAFGLGAIATPLLVTLFPWQSVLPALALVACVAAVLVRHAPNERRAPATHRPVSGWGWMLAAAVLVYAGLEQSLATFGSAYLVFRGSSLETTGFLLSAYWAAFTFGRLFLSYFVARNPLVYLNWLLLATLPILLLLNVPVAFLFPFSGFLIGPAFSTFLALGQARMGSSAVASVLYAGAIGTNAFPAVFALLPVAWTPLCLAILALCLMALVHLVSRTDVVTERLP